MSRLVLGTRGSDLARAQTSMVQAALRAVSADFEMAIEVITTRGDERPGGAVEPIDRRAGRKGMFTAEIERALLDGRIDVAVHSAKDLPSDRTPGLEICATLPRAAIEDVLIAKGNADLTALPAGAAIATGSVRRQYQLRSRRPDVNVSDLRGNVPTRLRKLLQNPWDAIILARAGLERLGFQPAAGRVRFEDHVLQCGLLALHDFVPAGGQGVIALQVRSGNERVRNLVRAVAHEETLLCLHAEREFLRLLQGDCDSPVGVLATISSSEMTVRAQVFNPPATTPLRGEVTGPAAANQIEGLVAKLMEQINAR